MHDDSPASRPANSRVDTDERSIENAALDADIEQRMVETDFGAHFAARGITTVSLDGDGRLIETAPDGSQRAVKR